MGSLASVPKISTTPKPQQQTKVKYVTVPAPSSSGSSSGKSGSSSSGGGKNESNTVDKAADVAQEREANLLRRSRGRTGTIRTSFRGLLDLSDAQQRKTLLGE